VQDLSRVGWQHLTCDQGWNKAASTQVKAKREDLTGPALVSFCVPGHR
jgi:hypothetical protein